MTNNVFADDTMIDNDWVFYRVNFFVSIISWVYCLRDDYDDDVVLIVHELCFS